MYSLAKAEPPKSCGMGSELLVYRREGREVTYCEGTRRIASDCPAPAAIEGCAFFHEDADDAAAAERLWVDLSLDFESVEREEDLVRKL